MFRYNGHESVKGTAESQRGRSEGGHAEEDDSMVTLTVKLYFQRVVTSSSTRSSLDSNAVLIIQVTQ